MERLRGAGARAKVALRAWPGKAYKRTKHVLVDTYESWAEACSIPSRATLKRLATRGAMAGAGGAVVLAGTMAAYEDVRGWVLAHYEAERRELLGRPKWDESRRALLANVRGVVYELGAGTGETFSALPRDYIEYSGTEPNKHAHELMLEEAARHGYSEYWIEVDRKGMEEFLASKPDASADAVIDSMGLARSERPERVLAEVRRVLRPGGRLYFMEPVAQPKGTLGAWLQRTLGPLYEQYGGVRPGRATTEMLEGAGFESVVMQWWPAPPANPDSAQPEPTEHRVVGGTAAGDDEAAAAAATGAAGTQVWYYGSRPSGVAPVLAGVATQPWPAVESLGFESDASQLFGFALPDGGASLEELQKQ